MDNSVPQSPIPQPAAENESSVSNDVIEQEIENSATATVRSSCSISSLLNNAEKDDIDEELNTLPDQAIILERLAQIREYKRQVLVMMDKMKNSSPEIDKEMLRKLVTAYDNFKDQEEQYLGVLQKILTFKHNFAIAAMEDTRTGPKSRIDQQNEQKFPISEDINGNKIKDSKPKTGPLITDNISDDVIAQQNADSAPAEIDNDVQSLIEQRNVLQKMMRQQEDLRALHGKMEAQQKQRENDGFYGPVLTNSEKDYLSAKQMVENQAASLAAKRQELEQLKEKLTVVATLSNQAELEENVLSDEPAQEQRNLESHLGLLKDKKQLMDQILGHLGDFEGPQRQRDENEQVSRALTGRDAISNPVSSVESTLQQKYNELLATKKRIADIQKMMTALEQNNNIPTVTSVASLFSATDQNALNRNQIKSNNKIYEQNKPDENTPAFNEREERANLHNIKRQLMVLGDEELIQITSASVNDDHVTEESLDRTPEQLANGVRNDDFLIDFCTQAIQKKPPKTGSSNSFHVQPQPLNNIRDNVIDFVPCRVVNACFDENAVSSLLSNGLDEGLDTLDDDACQQQRVPDGSAVVDRRNGGGQSHQIRNEGVGASAGQVDHQQRRQQQQHRQNNEAAVGPVPCVSNTDIAKNPRLASFRRNNDFVVPALNHNQRRFDSGQQQQQQPRRFNNVNSNTNNAMMSQSMTSSMDSQYDQLTRHIESIRSIFDSFMREQQRSQSVTGVENFGGQQATSPLNGSFSYSSTPMLAVGQQQQQQQQQQLLMTLLTCQQQLQLQQYELRYLHQMYQDLASFHHQQRSNEQQQRTQQQLQTANEFILHQQQQQQSVQVPSNPAHSDTFLQPGSCRSQISVPAEQSSNPVSLLDGRPLSSASLYNLLAPNPYLTAPYYPPRQAHTARGNAVPKNFVHNSTMVSSVNMSNSNPTNDSAYLSRSVCLPPTYSTASLSKYRKPSGMELSCISDRGLEMMAKEQNPEFGEQKIRNSRTASLGDCSSVSKMKAVDLDHRERASFLGSVGKKTKNLDNCQNNAENTMVSNNAVGMGSNSTPNEPILSDPFESLREMIYSEVATLISQNEQRPHYLLELFRELQLLSSDHLRMRAFQAIRDVLNRYLVEDSESNGGGGFLSNIRRVMDEAQNESCWTSDEEAFNQRRRAAARINETVKNATGFSETGCTNSTVSSTPEHASGFLKHHFSSNRNSQFSKASHKTQKRFDSLETSKDYKNRQTHLLNNAMPTKKKSCPSSFTGDSFVSMNGNRTRNDQSINKILANENGGELQNQVRKVSRELMTFIRESASEETCNSQTMQYLRKFLLTLVVTKCSLPSPEQNAFFHRKLSTSLDNILEKYRGQKLIDCSDNLIFDVSDAIFNELTFHRLMENIDTTIGNVPTPRGSSSRDQPKSTIAQSNRSQAGNATGHENEAINESGQTATKNFGARPSNFGLNMRSPSEFSERLPMDEFRRVDNALAYIDDDFRDVENEDIFAARENTPLPNNNSLFTPNTEDPITSDFNEAD